jgi:serine/threonine-protein kinase RsbT
MIEQVLAVLRRYVSAPTAQSILDLARQRAGKSATPLQAAALRELIVHVERSLRLFVADPAQAAACRTDLDRLAAKTLGATVTSLTCHIGIEDDIAGARGNARDLAVALGFTLVGQTRLVTAVSELARNIVQYAREGDIEFLKVDVPRGLQVTARDRGPGITNLEHVMTGNYRSRSGMGLGLRGVKKLADKFSIDTGAGGTTVSFMLEVK